MKRRVTANRKTKRKTPRKATRSKPQGKRREQDQKLALAFLGAPAPASIRLDHVISEHIKRVLEATDGNLSLGAVLLGMHRRSLQRYARRTKLRTRRKRGRR
jgi:transcriptional regulator with GAF, ATPase, and Fis domain